MAGRQAGTVSGGRRGPAVAQAVGNLSDEASMALPTEKGKNTVDHWPCKEPASVRPYPQEEIMNSIIYIVGLVVIIGIVLSYFGFR